ncbi:carbohydrate-binding module family 18 [Cryphonectria parasitica EP155]|uniref:chitinase n=1 Tax=Cryphonectria parasitica (strain ATCC 38755 / EP155) TaxID=660469 RepID=A0A9P4YDK0_CRYP1|nr:carbohydrate-binding module family 18 [Cryphonectria parasitica EP155]KAF3771083.1 carbohydrate-binding module family 18 [Cryphonectria parasitica EP155]
MVRGVGFTSGLAAAAVVATAHAAAPRYALYFDQYHTAVLPNRTMTAGITHVITAFANSSYFVADAGETMGSYTPFMDLTDIRAMFDNGTKVCMAIGGWGDLEGFRLGAATDASRAAYAQNVAATLDTLGYDCIDVDWEYPAGNGYDYKQVPNAQLTAEIETYPLFLAAIKSAIGDKELSIAVPALERDMLAYTAETVPQISAAVDFVNIMTYDLMNRRDNFTKHHTDVNGSLAAIETYLTRGMDPAKMNLGIAFYAKYFTLAANTTCTTGPIGCPIALAEDAEGQDTGTSGAVTFEATSFPAAGPTNLTASPDSSCGVGTSFACTGNATSGSCCSQYGFCGDTSAHCGTGCQSDYGTCAAATKSTAQSFADALVQGETDTVRGGQWWVDDVAGLFWTWDTPELVARKFSEIIEAKGLGGVMAWSLAEDSYDWGLLKAMQDGVAGLNAVEQKRKIRRRRY